MQFKKTIVKHGTDKATIHSLMNDSHRLSLDTSHELLQGILDTLWLDYYDEKGEAVYGQKASIGKIEQAIDNAKFWTTREVGTAVLQEVVNFLTDYHRNWRFVEYSDPLSLPKPEHAQNDDYWYWWYRGKMENNDNQGARHTLRVVATVVKVLCLMHPSVIAYEKDSFRKWAESLQAFIDNKPL